MPPIYPSRPRCPSATDAQTVDDRRSLDRRGRPTPIISRYWLRGRRSGRSGRATDRTGVYVDRYTRNEWLLVGVVIGLQVVDCLLTVYWLGRGAVEANPVMASLLIEAGLTGFVVAKLAIALSATAFLLLHIRYRRVRGALWGIAFLYALVAAWHVTGFARHGTGLLEDGWLR